MKLRLLRTRCSGIAMNASAAAVAVCVGAHAPNAIAQSASADMPSGVAGKPARLRRATVPPARSSGPEEVNVVSSRSRPLQHESLPSTVFDRRDIERAGITSPKDFIDLTPGVSIVQGNAPADSQVTIRGVSQNASATADSPVSILIDGVPLTSPNEFVQQLEDLQSIEVVKGAQNAIYGRNALGGAIVINTELPPEKLTASIDSIFTNGTGFNDTVKVGGAIIPNKVTASLVANEDYLGGFYKDITTDKYIDWENDKTIRGRLYITPTDNLSIDLKAGSTELLGGGLAWHAQTPGNPYYTGRIIDVNNTSEPYVADIPNYAKTSRNTESMRIDWDIPYGRVSSVSSYDFSKDYQKGVLFPYLPAATGEDGTQAALNTNVSYFEELKFSSKKVYNTRVQLGADYYDFVRDEQSSSGYTLDHTQYDGVGPFPVTSQNPTTAYSDDQFHTKAWELFAEATYDITRKLSIDGSARYTRDDIVDRNLAPAAYTTSLGEIRSAAFSKAEPRVALNYKVSGDINVYADWALGSLPGGFNPTGSAAAIQKVIPGAVVFDTYKQETSKDWEIGFNSQWLDRRLTVNGAFYYDILYNQQFDLYYPTAAIEVMNTIDVVHNIGGELQAIYALRDGWRFTVVVGYVHSQIMAFAADPTDIGNRPPFVPEYNCSFAIDKEIRLSEKYTGFARFEDSVEGTEYWVTDNFTGGRSNAINLAQIRLGVRTKKWSVTGFVANLADNRYNSSNVVLTSTAVATYLAPPREYGVEFKVGL